MSNIVFSRKWAMPSADTFSVKPIGEFVKKYLAQSTVSVDPFARDKEWFTHTNDLNPETKAQHHLESRDFLKLMKAQGIKCDLLILDPPYSPRQISECYKGVGKQVTKEDTQLAKLVSDVKDLSLDILDDDVVVLTFGWNSNGMGKKRGFEIIEILLISHGGSHADSICVAEKRIKKT